MKESIDFISKNVDDNSSIVVAVSGGPDSMALLSLLINIREKKNLNIIVAHINHNLREESNEEYSFVKKYCEDNNCIFEGTKFDKYNTNSIENEAREKRYLFFEEILKKYNSKYLFTAHHGDDLIETILMRLTRGSSIDGYSGFKKISIRNGYSILRPLIFVTKENILDYLDNNKIEYRIDKTNFSKEYTRNRYRLDILPLLKKENSNVHKKYLKFSEELEDTSSFISNYVDKKYNEIVINNKVNLDLLKKEDKYIIKRFLYKYLFNIYNEDISLIDDSHINEIISIIDSDKPNLKVYLPNDTVIIKSYDTLYVEEVYDLNNYKIEIKEETKLSTGKIIILKETDLTNNYVCHLDSNEIKLPLYVRNKRDGDYMYILNMNGKKKLKDIFIDSKINKEERNNIPVVVDSEDNIVWIPGIKKSKYDRLKDKKYDIILQYIKGGKNE